MSSERRQWNAKLFGCAEDWNTCCRVFWFPCVEHAEQGQFILERNRRVYWTDLSVYFILWFLCLEWTVGALRREDIRRKYNISAEPYEDLVTHLFCHPCASCQESRQLRIRMRNPSVRLSQPPSRGQSWSLSFNMLSESNLYVQGTQMMAPTTLQWYLKDTWITLFLEESRKRP